MKKNDCSELYSDFKQLLSLCHRLKDHRQVIREVVEITLDEDGKAIDDEVVERIQVENSDPSIELDSYLLISKIEKNLMSNAYGIW